MSLDHTMNTNSSSFRSVERTSGKAGMCTFIIALTYLAMDKQRFSAKTIPQSPISCRTTTKSTRLAEFACVLHSPPRTRDRAPTGGYLVESGNVTSCRDGSYHRLVHL